MDVCHIVFLAQELSYFRAPFLYMLVFAGGNLRLYGDTHTSRVLCIIKGLHVYMRNIFLLSIVPLYRVNMYYFSVCG